jgi:hypothetical protein
LCAQVDRDSDQGKKGVEKYQFEMFGHAVLYGVSQNV